MSKIKLAKKATPRKSAQTITRAEALRLFNLINDDTIPAAVCNEIGEVADVLINQSNILDTWRNREIFTNALLGAWPQTTSSYFRYWKKELRTILDRATAGDDPAQIIADLKAQREKLRHSDIERRAKKILNNPKIDRETKEAVRHAQKSEPFRLFCSAVFNAEAGRKMKPTGEPKDKLSNEWRHWKLRQFEQAFNSGEMETYTAAWTEFRNLLRGLMADENFWHTSHATELLPHLLSIRQFIDGQHLSVKRMRAGMKAAKTRKEGRG